MSKPDRTPAEVQRSLVLQVQSIAAHTTAISDELASMSKALREGMQSSTDPTAELLSATSQLTYSSAHASASLSDCLHDLQSMGEAMAPVLENSPEAAPALLLNFFSTFVTQMGSFYAEMNDGWTRGTQGYARGKAAFYREPAPATPRAAAVAAAATNATPSTATPAAVAAAQRTPQDDMADDGDVPAAHTGRRKKHTALEDEFDEGADADGAAPKKKPGKKKKAAVTAAAAAPAPADDEGCPLEEHGSAVRTPSHVVSDEGNSLSSRYSAEDRMAALAAAAESGAQTAAPRKGKRGSTAQDLAQSESADFAPQMTQEELDALAESEPPYLVVTSTVEAALGPMVINSRPNVFSNIATFTYEEPVSSYYIRLVRPGSLAYFVFKNYIQCDEETQADFLCDVLETDCAEVDPFTSPAGEVAVASADELFTLPPCAWGIGSSEDNERRLYTMYALTRQPPRQGPTAIIQTSLNMDGVRDEVLHMITLVDAMPQYAKVTCMVHSDVRSTDVPNQKQAAILSFTRSGYAQEGFIEVSEAEVKAAASRVRPKRGMGMELLPGRDRGTATTFQPPVQLAALDLPAGSDGISLGGVARGAMQGGMEVLKAPFTVGRAVGGALLDVTGVTGAMRNNMEGVFRKAFPELAGETVVDAFNCAWAKKATLMQGFAFITPHWLCFQSTVSAAKFSIEYDEIKDIVKSKSAKMFENALEIKTHLNDTIFLTSFLQRDQAYSALMKEWLKQ